MPDDPIDESMAALTQYFVGDSTMGEALDLLQAEFGHGKTVVTWEELETSRQLHARRKQTAN